MRGRKLITLVVLILLFSFATSTLALASDETFSVQAVDQAPIKVIHKDAPAPSNVVRPMDPQPPWYENVEMRTYTSTHFQIMTATIIASTLSAQFGGVAGQWAAAAASIIAYSYTLENNNVYEIVYYYWQPSYIDPQLPYYVKQFTVFYSDSARTEYIGSNTRYYYSNLPF